MTWFRNFGCDIFIANQKYYARQNYTDFQHLLYINPSIEIPSRYGIQGKMVSAFLFEMIWKWNTTFVFGMKMKI